MKTWILAGAVACAAMGPVLVDCNIATAASLETAKITDVNIGQIKGQLKLTADQLQLWARVEEVLRSIAREQAEGESVSLFRRIGRGVVSIAFDGTVTQRINPGGTSLKGEVTYCIFIVMTIKFIPGCLMATIFQ